LIFAGYQFPYLRSFFCITMKLVTFAFVTWVVSRASAQPEAESLLQITNVKDSCQGPHGESCTLWNMTVAVRGVHQSFLDPAYEVYQTYEINETGSSKDAAWLYRQAACSECTMVFRSTDSGFEETLGGKPSGDWGNNFNFTPIDMWGLSGVHAGVAAELEGLLALMDFQEIRNVCQGSFSVAGESSGGAMAQLFAVLLTKEHDPLGAKLKLHELNTFGSFAALMGPAWNDQSNDGCFAGTQSWYAQTTQDGGYAVDTLNFPQLGGAIHELVRGRKVFIVPAPDGSMTIVEHACGTPLPDAVDLLTHLQFNQDAFFALHEGYGQWLGCVNP